MAAGPVEDHLIALAAASLERVATALGPERALVLAVCDAQGRPTDVVVRDPEGRVAVLAGVPDDAGPELSRIVALAGGRPRSFGATDTAAEPGWPLSDAVEPESLMRMVVEQAPVPLLVANREGTILYASALATELGYTSAQLVGHTLPEFVHAGDQERLAHALAPLQRRERPRATIEMRWRRGGGSYAGIEARICAAGEQEGELDGGVVMAVRPLPRSWSGVGEMVADTHRHRGLADAADCGVAIVSGAHATLGAVIDANAPFGRIMGATTGQLVGTLLTGLVAERDGARLREALKEIASRGGQRVLEVALSDRVVADRLAEVTIKADADNGERGELLVRVRDVTEQLRLVDELTRAVDRLQLANKELAEFARITAHDLSAPLLAVSRLIDLISSGGDDPEFPVALDAIRSAIGRMHAMVDGVMGYTESLEATPARAPVDLDQVLDRVLDALAEELDQHRRGCQSGRAAHCARR